MKKFWAFILILFLGFFGILFYFVFYSHGFPGFVLSQWIHARYPEIKLQSFAYQSRSFHFFDEILFKDVHLVLRNGNATPQSEVHSFIVKSNKALWENEKKIAILVDDARMAIDHLKAKGIKLNLTLDFLNNKPIRMHGDLKMASIDFASARFEEISALLEGNVNQMRFKDFYARGYGGEIQGEILFDDLSVLSYDVNLTLTDMDSQALRSINNQIFSQVDGKFDGKIQLTGAGAKIKTLVCDLHVHPGGTIKAFLLGELTNYLPPSTQKEDLLRLLKTNGDIPIEKAVVQIKNVGEQTMVVEIAVGSKRLNLDIHEILLDINLDAPLGIYLQEFKNFP